MDLVNRTRYAAKLIASMVDEQHMMGSVIIRCAFSARGGRLVPEEKQDWPIGAAHKTDFGEFDDDTPFRKQGVDVMLLGRAYPAASGDGTRSRVLLRAGDVKYAIDVHGERVWKRTRDGLVPGEAQPFEHIDLTWENAYGGKCAVETGEMPYHANPFGKGFYLDEASAEGSPLPNLEDPADPVKTWADQPRPRGVAPMSRESSLRIMNSAEFDTETMPPKIKHIKPSYFNNANPDLVLEHPVEPGTIFAARGVRPDQADFGFRLPPGTFHAYVQLADRGYVFPAVLDTVALFPEDERVMLGFRCCFKYRLVPLERRAAVLYAGQAPSGVPANYRIDWAAFDEREVSE